MKWQQQEKQARKYARDFMVVLYHESLKEDAIESFLAAMELVLWVEGMNALFRRGQAGVSRQPYEVVPVGISEVIGR